MRRLARECGRPPANAAVYDTLLRSELPEILPGIHCIHRISGYRGAHLLRRDLGSGIEFVTLTYFNSLDAVRAFAGEDAGEDYQACVVPPGRARCYLTSTSAQCITKPCFIWIS
jgi:hypothetical protein